MPKFAKGSQEAKDYMAMLRAKRGQKKTGCGVNDPTPTPPPTAVIPRPRPRPAPAPRPPPLDLTEAQQIQREEAIRAVVEAIERRDGIRDLEGQGMDLNKAKIEFIAQRRRRRDDMREGRRIEEEEEEEERRRLEEEAIRREEERLRREEEERQREEERLRREEEERQQERWRVAVEKDEAEKREKAQEKNRRNQAHPHIGLQIELIMKEADYMNPADALEYVRSQRVLSQIPRQLIVDLIRHYQRRLDKDDGGGKQGSGITKAQQTQRKKAIRAIVEAIERRDGIKGGRLVRREQEDRREEEIDVEEERLRQEEEERMSLTTRQQVERIMEEANTMNPTEAIMFVRSQEMLEELPSHLIAGLIRHYQIRAQNPQGRGITGEGWGDIQKTLKRTVKKTRRVINKISKVNKMVERNDLPPKVRSLLKKNGDKIIASAVINRKPVQKQLTSLLNAVSFGQFKKNISSAPYDELFHLSIVLNTTDGKRIMVEKNEVINMSMTPKKGGETYPITPFSTGKTLNEIMENTRKKMGDTKFFSYSARNNNCQDFIMSLLQANGMGDADEFKFVKQDTKQMFKGLKTLSTVADFITDMAGTADVIIKGKGNTTSHTIL